MSSRPIRREQKINMDVTMETKLVWTKKQDGNKVCVTGVRAPPASTELLPGWRRASSTGPRTKPPSGGGGSRSSHKEEEVRGGEEREQKNLSVQIWEQIGSLQLIHLQVSAVMGFPVFIHLNNK
ncbi:hypothetical protein CRENBAI_013494 [Crenichthys baileyi]|uniref:Uncharacterized protein n=1 Tax=Crenichthys baileyi TaxID=28760 RepID=A0AAV9SCB5_9TELE